MNDTCMWCGEEFHRSVPNRRYCSVLCRSRNDLHRRSCDQGDSCTVHERTNVPGRQLPTLKDRVLRHVDQSGGPDACWPWTGRRNRWGYGASYYYDGEKRVDANASRVAYIAENGPLPPDMHVLHSCDNPPCCNPRHLRAGTHLENMADRKARGRYSRRVIPLAEEASA